MNHPTEAHLQAYIDRQLSAEEAKRVRNHLRTCSQCRRLFYLYQMVFEQLRTEPQWQFSDRFEKRILHKIHKQPLGEVFQQLWYALITFGVFIAALGVTMKYMNVQLLLEAFGQLSFSSFKIALGLFKPFMFLPEVGSLLKSDRHHIHFFLLCIAVLVIIAVLDQVVRFFKSRLQNGL